MVRNPQVRSPLEEPLRPNSNQVDAPSYLRPQHLHTRLPTMARNCRLPAHNGLRLQENASLVLLDTGDSPMGSSRMLPIWRNTAPFLPCHTDAHQDPGTRSSTRSSYAPHRHWYLLPTTTLSWPSRQSIPSISSPQLPPTTCPRHRTGSW